MSVYIWYCSVTQSCPTLWYPMDWSTPSFPVHLHPPEIAQTHVHWVSDAIQPSHPLSPLLFLPSILPSIRVFSNESALHVRWPKYWRFSFNISPSNEYSGLISFRTDGFDLLTVQGTLKSILQHQCSKASKVSKRSLSHFRVRISLGVELLLPIPPGAWCWWGGATGNSRWWRENLVPKDCFLLAHRWREVASERFPAGLLIWRTAVVKLETHPPPLPKMYTRGHRVFLFNFRVKVVFTN